MHGDTAYMQGVIRDLLLRKNEKPAEPKCASCARLLPFLRPKGERVPTATALVGAAKHGVANGLRSCSCRRCGA